MQQQYYNQTSIQSLQRRGAPAPAQKRCQTMQPASQSVQFASAQISAPSQYSQAACFEFEQNICMEDMYGQISEKCESSYTQDISPASADEFAGAYEIDYNKLVEHDESMIAQYGNDPDPLMDLGADGAFSKFKVLYGTFSYSYGLTTLVPALEKKGFQVTKETNVKSFLDKLEGGGFDVICFVSSHKIDPDNQDERFKKLLLDAYKKGIGIFMFADNRPFFYQCNLILPTIADCTLIGNDNGNQKLVFGTDPKEPGRFDMEHLLFSGINNMYEGVTISYPTEGHSLKVVATNTHGHPVICIKESDETHGRVVVDVGFTKLDQSYWQETGQARYIVNACVWLVDLERRGEVEPVAREKC